MVDVVSRSPGQSTGVGGSDEQGPGSQSARHVIMRCSSPRQFLDVSPDSTVGVRLRQGSACRFTSGDVSSLSSGVEISVRAAGRAWLNGVS